LVHKSVLYICSHITGTSKYFAGAHYPEIWYARHQRRMIKAFKVYQSTTQFYVKFYPNESVTNINKEWFQECVDWAISLQDSIIECLRKSTFDLIIIDTPSTTLLQSLCTKSQILVFFPDRAMYFFPEAEKLLEKRAFIAHDETELFQVLDQVLNGNFTPKPINQDFLFAYGLGNKDEDLFKNTIKAIEAVIHEQSA
jgi:hypothetical protein